MTRNTMNKTTYVQIASVLPIAAATLALAQPLTYTIQELPALESNRPDRGTNAIGMNEAGHVVGVAEDDLGLLHTVVWIDAQIAIVVEDEPGLAFVNGKGINNNDVIVGQGMEQLPSGAWQGCPMAYEDGVGIYRPYEPPPVSGWAWAINDSGQIGYTVRGEMVIYDPIDGIRSFELPGYPVGFGQEVWEINNAGQACGAARGADYFWHSYRYDYATDTLVDLHDEVMFRHTVGYGINEAGDIAGWGVRHDNWQPPVVWAADGRQILLAIGDLGYSHAYGNAEHINGHGTVVGMDISGAGEQPIGWIAYDALSVGPADVTTQGAADGDPFFGVPDRLITASDINFYVNAWGAGDLAIADVTTQGAGPGDTGYGIPDGLTTAADINYYVNAWVAGPTTPTKLVLRDQLSPADNIAWTRMHPFEINDAGQICGTGVWNGTMRGFLMTPAPGN